MFLAEIFGRSAKFSAKYPHLKFQNLMKFWVKIPKFVFFFFKCGWESVKMSEYQKKNFCCSISPFKALKSILDFFSQTQQRNTKGVLFHQILFFGSFLYYNYVGSEFLIFAKCDRETEVRFEKKLCCCLKNIIIYISDFFWFDIFNLNRDVLNSLC